MFRCSPSLRFISKIMKVSRPPVSGYEMAELPNEKLLGEFMQYYKTKGIIVIFHNADGYARTVGKSGDGKASSGIESDPLTRSFISSINGMNLGNPDEVKLALAPGTQCPRMVDTYNILTYPTALLFLDNTCVYRVTGARTNELSIKSLFMLRNGSRNIFSRV
ncbi:hypothetical protein AGDE_04722 [Angomonas deanei]|nr:hypothetical protein AGDE_04722 [Angomonas deanei]|eukprot:EPY39206.1 hypothetical protein AGDE_04722 [Angomonas deanei]